jgi:hypothetical protein
VALGTPNARLLVENCVPAKQHFLKIAWLKSLNDRCGDGVQKQQFLQRQKFLNQLWKLNLMFLRKHQFCSDAIAETDPH